MKNRTEIFNGRGNRKLFYQYWIPDSGISKAIIITLHGWATHSDRLKNVADYFTEKGYGIYSFDLRGHWRNTGEIPGHIESLDNIQKDVVLFRDLIKKEYTDKQIFIMGHSFGGLISLIYAIQHPGIPGVLVSSPMLGLSLDLSVTQKVGKIFAGPFAKINPTKVIDMKIQQNLLTSDLRILREHIADKHKLEQITAKTYSEMKDAMKWAIDNASKLTCPLFIMQAGMEKVVDKIKTKEFFERVKGRDKSYKEYDGFLHELWNEKGRAQVFQGMFVWLEKHLIK
ncbi:MAG: lysophospholipase [Candidatus Lokiarchaeota archaeon]